MDVYDVVGNWLVYIDVKGVMSIISYDVLNCLMSIIYLDIMFNVVYYYDEVNGVMGCVVSMLIGCLICIVESVVIMVFCYDV